MLGIACTSHFSPTSFIPYPFLIHDFLDSLWNPIVCRLDCGCMVLLCVIRLFPTSLWKSCLTRGWHDTEILMRTLAYRWVERCSDIASCGATPFQDKYFLMLIMQCICFMNYYEHIECVEINFLPLYIISLCILICMLYFNAFVYYVHGARLPRFDREDQCSRVLSIEEMRGRGRESVVSEHWLQHWA